MSWRQRGRSGGVCDAGACDNRRARLLSVFGLLLATSVAACYRPSIEEGGLSCTLVSHSCPDGFSCFGGRCYHHDPDAGPSDRAEVGDALPDRVDADAIMCVERQPIGGCIPKASLVCDPVCQSGCCTTQKCTALNTGPAGATTAALGCAAGGWLRALGETCDVSNAGTAARSDNCLPGLLCVEGNSDAVCLQLCRSDADCAGGVKCETRRIEPTSVFSASVCGLQATTCSPTASVSGCPAGRTCYLISSDKVAGDQTVCDISSGDGGNGSSCKYPFECLPGWTCPTAGVGAGRCQAVCAHNSSPPNICPQGLTCRTAGSAYDLCL